MDRTARSELKCPISLYDIENIERDISQFLILDPFLAKTKDKSHYRIRSLYFESEQNHFYREKLAGVSERVKLRIRTYFPVSADNPIFLEIKYKNNARQRKLRKVISFADYQNIIAGRYSTVLKNQKDDKVVVLFINFLLKYAAKPRLCIDYNRRAYMSKFKSHYMRATFDSQIGFQLSDDLFKNPDTLQHQLDQKYVILELKFENDIPFWMQAIIMKYNLDVSALSKYAIATRRLLS